MIALWLWFLVLGVAAAQAPDIRQQTHGSCSPTVGQTGGNVNMTINCPGVDPKALDAFTRELGVTQGQLRLTNQQLEKANDLFRRYHELFRQAGFIQDPRLTPRAQDLVREGRLKEAETLLNRSTISMAQYHAIREGQTGMSYQEVVNILGRPGIEQGRSGPVVSYTWGNPDGSLISITFTDGRAMSKVQHGLR
jgi:hypothetical protein